MPCRDFKIAKGGLYCSSANMPHYEGVSSFHHEAKKQYESFICWSSIVEALTCSTMKVSEGFNNAMLKQVGKFHSRGVDVVVEGFNGRSVSSLPSILG
jgi:hypothetical protein